MSGIFEQVEARCHVFVVDIFTSLPSASVPQGSTLAELLSQASFDVGGKFAHLSNNA
jgi:hypothetical protein